MTKSIESVTSPQLSRTKRALLEKLSHGDHERPGPSARRIPRRADAAPRLVNFFQESLWFGEQFSTSSESSNNLFGCMSVRGALDAAAFERALAALRTRHAMLRSAFDSKKPLMVVADEVPVPLTLVDLSAVPERLRLSEALRRSRALGIRRIPITQAPLWSCTLYRITPEEHLLTIVTHHLVADGWSFGVILTELSSLYDAQVLGRDPELPALDVDYSDYAYWQRNRADWANDLDYWMKVLSGPLPTLSLPGTKRTRELPQVDTLTFSMSEGLSEDVRAFSRSWENSPFVTLLATYQLFLHRLSGQRDLLVGSPSAGRETETENLVGVFITFLVLRTQLDQDERLTFLQFLESSKQTTFACMEHQDVPIEKVLEVLPDKPQFYGASFFQALFDMFNFPMPKDGHALKMRPQYMDGGMAPFDVSLFVDDSAKQEMVVTLAYRADLFERETVEGWARGWLALLSHAIARPNTPITELPMTSDAPLRQHVADDARPSQHRGRTSSHA